MRLSQAILVIVDISGYTDFIANRSVSLLHAEQIITDLMEAVIDRAEHPLTVNKLEGDAALLYREIGDAEPGAVARSVLAQLRGFFDSFATCLQQVTEQRRNCSCDACANISRLCLKAFLHSGEIAVKQVRQFEELAGENVILIHRMLKNTVSAREYVLASDAFHALAGGLPGASEHQEQAEGLGSVRVWLSSPADLPPAPPSAAATTTPTTTDAAIAPQRIAGFHHLPRTAGGASGWWQALKRRFR